MPKPKTEARDARRAARARAHLDALAALDALRPPTDLPAHLQPLYRDQLARLRLCITRTSLVIARATAHQSAAPCSDSDDAVGDEPQRTS